MIHASPASTETARRLWAGESVETAEPKAVMAAIEQVCARLRLGLGRWIGSEGYGALLERVLEEAVTDTPALRGFRFPPDGEDKVAGTVSAREVPAVIRSFVSAVALLIQRLSQVIGEDMAMQLVEQAWTAGPSDGPIDEIGGANDDQEVRSR